MLVAKVCSRLCWRIGARIPLEAFLRGYDVLRMAPEAIVPSKDFGSHFCVRRQERLLSVDVPLVYHF